MLMLLTSQIGLGSKMASITLDIPLVALLKTTFSTNPHQVRPVPLEIYIDGFPEQHGFCPLMQSMNRPAFLAIKTHSPRKPVIIFVASRRQTRLTAKDMIAFCGLEDNPRQFLHISEEELQGLLSQVKDRSLKEALQFGVGLHHAGLIESDRQLVEELFTYNRIQVLVATSTLAWGVRSAQKVVKRSSILTYLGQSPGPSGHRQRDAIF